MTIEQNTENGRVRDERIKILCEKTAENKTDISVLADAIIKIQIDVARLSERMALFQIAQGVFTVLATGIAVYMSNVK